MKALFFEKTGELAALKIAERPRPEIKDGEALVRVRAAAINPSDPKNVLGRMSETKPPRIPGRDFAGEVVDGPTEWVGRSVLGSGGNLGFGRDGTHAEFAAVPVAALVEKPARLSFAAGAALGVGYLTAWSMVVTAGRLSRDDTMLVIGAQGAVGSAAIGIAKSRGVKRIIGTVRNAAEMATAAKTLQVDAWLSLDGAPLPEQIAHLTEGRGVDLALNVVGGKLTEPVNQSLAYRGRHVVIASLEPVVSFNLVDFYHREASLIGVDTLKLSFAESARILAEVVPLVAAGKLPAPAHECVSVDRAIEAYEAVLTGRAKKKQVIEF